VRLQPKLGFPRTAAGGLAELPQIVDKASPDGQLMDEKSLDDALGKLASAAR
jgi:uncharacterized protein YidB (DUF937 family)